METSERPVIQHHSPVFGSEELEYVQDAVASGWVSYAGEYVSAFERQVALASGARFALALSSGTCALQVAYEMLGRRGTEVILPALTFAAPASAAVRGGLTPVFVDVNPRTWQMDTRLVRDFLEHDCTWDGDVVVNKRSRRRVSTICVVHLFGALADIDELLAIAGEYRLDLIQDAAQSLGARHRGAPFAAAAGPDTARCIVTTSFNANKIVTTGAGGALMSHDGKLVERARHLSSTAKVGADGFVHDDYGLNYRMSNVNAALGCAQLAKLEGFIERKRVNDTSLRDRLSHYIRDVQFMELEAAVSPNYWSTCVLMPSDSATCIKQLNAAGIHARPVWVPLPELGIYREFAAMTPKEHCTAIWRRGIMLPSGACLTSADIDQIVEELRRVWR